jgi:CxxC motif-containing protein (DUF1111 family)
MKSLRLSLAICSLAVGMLPIALTSLPNPPATEAPAGFDGQTNGFLTQAQFEAARSTFEDREEISNGLGPVYNAQSCTECHQNPLTGGISQVTEMRAGHRAPNGAFVDAPGGSLINDRAIDAAIQETVPPTENVRTFRTSLNTLGDGFVECIDDATLQAIAASQPGQSAGFIAGQVIQVAVFEAPGQMRVGRFGWKNQQASLLSFSADAYLNEMGITNRFLTTENTSMGNSVAAYDTVADPEDTANDIDEFAAFMRATKAPPRDTVLAATPAAVAGSNLFDQIGCAVCHVRTIITAPAGTPINGGAFTVPPELGNKMIHPFGDFLLHDVGTGDGIVQNGGQGTANKMRTAPLWGVRTRSRLMHDGEAETFRDAILRHLGEATPVTIRFLFLSQSDQQKLLAFLKSL